ncbi:MAG: PhoD-like phosphatase N-terminal domain-containing protein, partial [Planctomycetota bacterium]
MMAGEPTSDSILLQTRLTAGTQLDDQGDLPGHRGIARFEWSTDATFVDAETSTWSRADAASDFIVRHCLTGLQAATRYYYRVHFAINDESPTEFGPIGSFRTLGGRDSIEPTTFLVGSCMNYIKFMHGRAGNAGGPITATAKDKRLGFPAFATMNKIRPDFFVGTGDIVYYDNPFRVARTVTELRNCWHEQFRFPRMIEFFRDVPCYWSKDDHDFRFNDSDNEGDRIPLPQTGINLFREQLPIAPAGDVMTPNYRTHRVNRHLQIWLTEGRDHRSANDAEDGPNKSMWGPVQKQWLKQTLAKSDATW